MKRPYAPVTTDKLYHIASTTLDEAVYEGVVAELYYRLGAKANVQFPEPTMYFRDKERTRPGWTKPFQQAIEAKVSK